MMSRRTVPCWYLALEKYSRAWKGYQKLRKKHWSQELIVNVKMTKTTISSENAEKVTMEGKFLCAVCRKDVRINSILCELCRCWMHKRCNGHRGKLKENSKFKCQACANQLNYMASLLKLWKIFILMTQ